MKSPGTIQVYNSQIPHRMGIIYISPFAFSSKIFAKNVVLYLTPAGDLGTIKA